MRGHSWNPSSFKSTLCVITVFLEMGENQRTFQLKEDVQINIVTLEARKKNPKFFLLGGNCANHWGKKMEKYHLVVFELFRNWFYTDEGC